MLTPLLNAQMQQAMRDKPHSLQALCDLTGLAKPTVTRFVRELQAAVPPLVHVGAWGRDARGYPTIREYSWGNAPDAACPRTDRTSATRMSVQRAQAKKCGKKP